jgi:hypothetical protein
MKVMQSVYNCQGTHKKLRIIHEFEIYKLELDKLYCITVISINRKLKIR